MGAPTLIGPEGSAWRLDIPGLMQKNDLTEDNCSVVAGWIVHQPRSHPRWPWYRISLIHLRELKEKPEGVGAPVIRLEGATHEFMIQAISPDSYPIDTADWPTQILSPANFASQVAWGSDEVAATRLEQEVIKPIIHGFFNADSDGLSLWISAFGDNMVKRD